MEGGHFGVCRQEPPDSELLTVIIVAEEAVFCNIRCEPDGHLGAEFEEPAACCRSKAGTTHSKFHIPVSISSMNLPVLQALS
jgi:hypothetical protein